jgi:hypothetical protein
MKLVLVAALALVVAPAAFAGKKTDKKENNREIASTGVSGTITSHDSPEQLFLMVNGPVADSIEQKIHTGGRPQQVQFGIRCFNQASSGTQIITDPNQPLPSTELSGAATSCVISKFIRN